MIAKKHVMDGRKVLALCDEKILGEKIEEGVKILDTGSAFYKGSPVSEEELDRIIPAMDIINAAGEKCVEYLIRKKITNKEDIKTVAGVPHIQIFL